MILCDWALVYLENTTNEETKKTCISPNDGKLTIFVVLPEAKLFCSLDCCPSGALSTIFPLFKTNQEIVIHSDVEDEENLYYIHINDQTQRNKQRDSEKLVNMICYTFNSTSLES
ncbi:Phosphotransferase UL97 [Trichinella spiralis]|uniref:Phosphotransferase UL97 n=1 Tax=Trichinella spiralis TaxID=6334 RepID=A0ABR3KXP5_TRISP